MYAKFTELVPPGHANPSSPAICTKGTSSDSGGMHHSSLPLTPTSCGMHWHLDHIGRPRSGQRGKPWLFSGDGSWGPGVTRSSGHLRRWQEWKSNLCSLAYTTVYAREKLLGCSRGDLTQHTHFGMPIGDTVKQLLHGF